MHRNYNVITEFCLYLFFFFFFGMMGPFKCTDMLAEVLPVKPTDIEVKGRNRSKKV